jgi:tripartite-type tricarboxylate transporter receptor subunit TctC
MNTTLNRRQTLALLAATPFAHAQPKVIRLIVPYPAGGPLDVMARTLADKVKDTLGIVVVENRPGAGGNIGADAVAKAAPDGTTIVMGAVATHAINPWLYAKIPYDPLRDFTPLTLVARVPNVLVMNVEAAQRLRIASVRDLVAYAKANPGRLNYGSGGNGSAGHLAGEMFKAKAGVWRALYSVASDRITRGVAEPGVGSASVLVINVRPKPSTNWREKKYISDLGLRLPGLSRRRVSR